MSADGKLPLVLCWHMHQPDYRDHATGEYQEPWTYLHAIKDYSDMATHLERHPQARAVVNFSPLLLDQIEDYAQQVRAYLRDGSHIRDPLLGALASVHLPVEPEARLRLMHACIRANEDRLVRRFPAYHKLVALVRQLEDDCRAAGYLSDVFLHDLVVWYHLAWVGEGLRRESKLIAALTAKSCHFDLHDRRQLLEVVAEVLEGLIGRYRTLSENGQVELAMSPYGHPILPLLLDLKSAREALPEMHLPLAQSYPDGRERARWHLRHGREVFKRHFGAAPQGIWPSEGAVSEETLELLAEEGFSWFASGENVLHNSLRNSEDLSTEGPHQVYRFGKIKIDGFFRDDGLSDAIGFQYANWHEQDAVNDLIHHLQNIGRKTEALPSRLVCIIMDGENAWEYFRDNAFPFLDRLYGSLSSHADIRLTTFSEHAARTKARRQVASLVAGSWVYGTLSTWIGDVDKNRGWDLLCEAKQAFDKAVAKGAEVSPRVLEELASCEGSDWFWWFGDYNPAVAVGQFDRLFRMHLSNLYLFLGLEPPDQLTARISVGQGSPDMGGVMRRGNG